MAVNLFFLALMPISHAVSWWLVLRAEQKRTDDDNQPDTQYFYFTVASIAAFYCAWALYKVLVGGDKQEKGHISMGFLALSATFLQTYPYVILAANGLVIVNFAVVIPFFINRGVAGIVKMVHKEVNGLTMTWGYVFLTYLLCNIVLWCYTFKTILSFIT